MEADITVESVKAIESRSGNTRYVLRDSEGREYTPFRPKIGKEAAGYEGRRARITFHEEERNGFHNVYLRRDRAGAGRGRRRSRGRRHRRRGSRVDGGGRGGTVAARREGARTRGAAGEAL